MRPNDSLASPRPLKHKHSGSISGTAGVAAIAEQQQQWQQISNGSTPLDSSLDSCRQLWRLGDEHALPRGARPLSPLCSSPVHWPDVVQVAASASQSSCSRSASQGANRVTHARARTGPPRRDAGSLLRTAKAHTSTSERRGAGRRGSRPPRAHRTHRAAMSLAAVEQGNCLPRPLSSPPQPASHRAVQRYGCERSDRGMDSAADTDASPDCVTAIARVHPSLSLGVPVPCCAASIHFWTLDATPRALTLAMIFIFVPGVAHRRHHGRSRGSPRARSLSCFLTSSVMELSPEAIPMYVAMIPRADVFLLTFESQLLPKRRACCACGRLGRQDCRQRLPGRTRESILQVARTAVASDRLHSNSSIKIQAVDLGDLAAVWPARRQRLNCYSRQSDGWRGGYSVSTQRHWQNSMHSHRLAQQASHGVAGSRRRVAFGCVDRQGPRGNNAARRCHGYKGQARREYSGYYEPPNANTSQYLYLGDDREFALKLIRQHPCNVPVNATSCVTDFFKSIERHQMAMDLFHLPPRHAGIF